MMLSKIKAQFVRYIDWKDAVIDAVIDNRTIR